MNTLFQVKILGIALLLISVSGCSVIDSYRSPQPQARSRSLPKIPEIKRQAVVKPRYTRSKKVTRVQKTPIKKMLRPKNNVITSRQKTLAKERLKEQAKENATVDLDPYAAVPENKTVKIETVKSEVTTNKVSKSSPAVKSLMVGARADIAMGKNSSAVSKLERGLRIESQNPELWHLLSKANYSDSNYEQSINMAKKSNRYSNNDNLIAQNWALIKKRAKNQVMLPPLKKRSITLS